MMKLEPLGGSGTGPGAVLAERWSHLSGSERAIVGGATLVSVAILLALLTALLLSGKPVTWREDVPMLLLPVIIFTGLPVLVLNTLESSALRRRGLRAEPVPWRVAPWGWQVADLVYTVLTGGAALWALAAFIKWLMDLGQGQGARLPHSSWWLIACLGGSLLQVVRAALGPRVLKPLPSPKPNAGQPD
jgi:hypothetical protein